MMDRRQFLRITASAMLSTALFGSSSVFGSQDASRWVDAWWEEGRRSDSGSDVDEGMPEGLKPSGAGAIGPYCEGRLRLKSSIHGESYEFNFRKTSGEYDGQVLANLNWFLRCRDGSWQHMDINAIETLNYLSKLLGDPLIQINSGYRSPDYNAKLSRKNENVARNSLHMYGQAIDFSIPGIPIREVCSYALYARNIMGYGGVGYYPSAGFVHLDSGRTKEWVR